MAKDTIQVVTPVGELWYCNITGQGKENYNEDGYNYVASVYIPKAQAQPLIDQIQECLGAVPKGKNVKSLGWRELMKDEEGIFVPTSAAENMARQEKAEKTGIICFTFSTKTTFDDGKPKKIGVYNSAKPPTKLNMGDKLIGNGSKGAISGKMKRFEKAKDVGVSLFLNAVQLVEYVEYTGDAGFEGVEGGFSGFSDEMPGAEAPASTDEKPKEEEKKVSKPKL